MRISARKRIRETELNMTPMIDVVFLLITFFMLVTEITRQDDVEDLRLPDVRSAGPDDKPDPKRLVINIAVQRAPRIERGTGRRIWAITKTGIVIIGGIVYHLYDDQGRPHRADMQKIKNLLAVEARLSRDPTNTVQRVVLVKADRAAPFRDVRAIIDMCIDRDVSIWRLAFGTKPFESKQAKQRAQQVR